LNPRLIEVDNINRDVEAVRNRFEWLLVDTPPLDMDVIEGAVINSDAVVVPIRCSLFDLCSITPIVEMCRAHRKPFQFLLSAVDSKMPKLTEQIMAALVKEGPIFATRVSYRQAYIQAVAAGRVGFEIDKSLSTEIDNLWAEVKRLASSPIPIVLRACAANE